MLGMAEEYMIGKVVNLNPFNWRPRIESTYYFGYFKCAGPGSVSYKKMAIHTNIFRRDSSCFAVGGITMAVNTINFILPGMNSMRKFYRLIRGIELRPA